eukprot:TRINITY_DN1734_c1_g1_i1.p1 TRINITY_DN1734_c1_g1~~TRINITY_DN1734_c1_g1_i1.p1  ORF type:complete len:119 (+),score=24.23 TRINITY_DN1734_c1_g1_i1:62-418(+)
MNKANKSEEDANHLESTVFGWASGHRETCDEWLVELGRVNVKTVGDLVGVAGRNSHWQTTLDKLSDGLVAKLEKWKRDVFDKKFVEELLSSTVSSSLSLSWYGQAGKSGLRHRRITVE